MKKTIVTKSPIALVLDAAALVATDGGAPALNHKPGPYDGTAPNSLHYQYNTQGTQTGGGYSSQGTQAGGGYSSRPQGTQTDGRFVSAPPSYTSGSGHSSPGGYTGPSNGFSGYQPGRWG